MGTYCDLSGSFDDLAPELVGKLREAVDELGIEVDDDGYIYFNNDCGYGFFSEADTALQTFAAEHKVAGECTMKSDEDDEPTQYFFGTDDQIKRQRYFYQRAILQNAQRDFDAAAEGVTDADLARWKLESGG